MNKFGDSRAARAQVFARSWRASMKELSHIHVKDRVSRSVSKRVFVKTFSDDSR